MGKQVREVSKELVELTETLVPSLPGDETTTLAGAKERHRAALPRGGRCSCCGRFDKIYERKFTSTMALVLVILYREYLAQGKATWVTFTKFIHTVKLNDDTRSALRGGMAFMLQYWGLINRKGRSDIEITPRGVALARQEISIPASAFVFHSKVVGFSVGLTDLRTAFGTKFDLDKLLSDVSSVIDFSAAVGE